MRIVKEAEERRSEILDAADELFGQKIQKVILGGVVPVLAGIIREGIEQGLFSTPFPYEGMEMIVVYANTVFDDEMVAMTNEERASRLQALVFNAERLLGAENGILMDASRIFGSGNGGGHE